jgi:hypothetical protein
MGEDRSLTTKLLGVLVLVLLLSVGLKVFEDVQTNPSACQQSSPTSLDLANLELLPFSIPSSSRFGLSEELRNSTFLSMVGTSYGTTITSLIPQTVVGYLQNSEMWKNWTLQNMVDPPSWINAGPIPALNQQFSNLQTELLNSTSSGAAQSDVMNFAASVSGYSLAALDFHVQRAHLAQDAL